MAAIETAFMAVAFGEQVAQGTILAATRDLAGALDLTNGIVLGDKESGQMESGISISFVREGRDRPVVGGSQTWQQDEFLRQQVGTFSVAFPFSGNRKTTTTPLDAEFQQDPGIEAILKACGLTSAADGSGVGWEYLPGAATYATAKVWTGVGAESQSWALLDCIGSLSISKGPGGIPIATATFQAIMDTYAGAIAMPTFDYEEQSSVSAKIIESMGASWGGVRGWSDLTLNIDNDVQLIADSNALNGERAKTGERNVNVSMTMFDDDVVGIEYAQLNQVLAAAPTDDLTFTTGTNAGGAAALDYIISVNNLQITEDLTPDRVGGEHSTTVTARASGTTANSEFSLIFR